MTKESLLIGNACFAHKGEVIVVNMNASVTRTMFLPPQSARELAQSLINTAEMAEQQMDEQQP